MMTYLTPSLKLERVIQTVDKTFMPNPIVTIVHPYIQQCSTNFSIFLDIDAKRLHDIVLLGSHGACAM